MSGNQNARILNRTATATLSAATNLADGAALAIVDTAGYRSNQINNIYTFNATIEHMARYVRFSNFSGNQTDALTLYYQLSN